MLYNYSIEVIINTIEYIRINYEKRFKRNPYYDFTKDYCYFFAEALTKIFNKGHIMCNSSHCVFFYNNHAYDITGEVNPEEYPDDSRNPEIMNYIEISMFKYVEDEQTFQNYVIELACEFLNKFYKINPKYGRKEITEIKEGNTLKKVITTMH